MKLTQRQLTQLASRKLTKAALAKTLGVSHTYLCRMTPKLPPGVVCAKRRETHKLAETRKGHRNRMAAQVVSGYRSLESAAKQANCSLRTMYRYVCKVRNGD